MNKSSIQHRTKINVTKKDNLEITHYETTIEYPNGDKQMVLHRTIEPLQDEEAEEDG